MPPLVSLPIDAHLGDLVARLRRDKKLVLVAPPGSGKTTRVPRALLDADFPGEIVVLEPRRLATRMAAQRVADELGERVGKRVGYTVRFEDVTSRETRIRFVTEGVLTRRLLADPELRGVSAVLLDEFHERHLQGDLALALLQRLLERRSDLHVVVMSATLDAEIVAAHLGAEIVRAEGQRFDVEIEHIERADDRPLGSQVASGVRKLTSETSGDLLVFLPGAREIRDALTACEPIARERNLVLLPLHGDLTPDEQDRAVRRSRGDQRKVILSTNIAESSVTIDGVTGVVDAGLARVARFDPWSGLGALVTEPVSRASATQRAGRAGRTAPGKAFRLYTRADFDRRRDHDAPEIARSDLASTVLELAAWDLGEIRWLTTPPEAAWTSARELLVRLGALGSDGRITARGRAMLRHPVHPRLARLVVEGEARGVGHEACVVAALLGERDLRREARAFGDAAARPSEASDVIALYDLFLEAEDAGFSQSAIRALSLDPGSVRAVDRAQKQLRSHVRPGGANTPKDIDAALSLSVLAAFPDRVAKRRKDGSRDFALAGSGVAELSERSVVRHARWIVAVAADHAGQKPIVRVASAIEPDWLIELFADRIEERTEAVWNADKESASSTAQMLYDGLVLDESKSKSVTTAESELLFRMAKQKGLGAFCADDGLTRWLLRATLAGAADARVKAPTQEQLDDILREACEGRRTFEELRQAGLFDLVVARTEGAGRIHELAPDRITLPSGRTPRVEYETGKPPYVESYLQDFCGLKETPKVAGVPLVMHLLAPNKRAVQVTTDLKSFFTNHYPAIRKELGRKYPRHAWPEDPSAPVPMKQRR